MAFASVGTLGATANKTAGTSIAHTTTAAAAAGSLVVVAVAKDNAGTTDASGNEFTSVTDSVGGNTWTKAGEYTYGSVGANNGAAVAVWFSRLTNALGSGATITANFSDSRTAKAISAWNYSVGAAVAVDGTPAGTVGANQTTGSLTCSGLANVEHLAVRAVAKESPNATGAGVETGWSELSLVATSGGSSTTNMASVGLWSIVAASTSITSNPNAGATGDSAIILVTLREVAGGPTTYNDTRSEPATSDHTQTSTATFPNAQSETATAGDSVTGGILHTATLAEAATAGHDQSGAITAGNQFLRPDGQISTGSWTNDFSALDETSADDGDFAYSQDNPNGSIFEVSLSDPAGTPQAGTTTVRYRHAQVSSGVVDGTGTATALNVSVIEGTTTIASDAEQAPGGSWVTREWTPDLSGVTDWTDVRLRFTATGGGGSPASRRGVGVSWAEIEIPQAGASTYNVSRTEPATAADDAASVAVFPASAAETGTAGDAVTGGLLSTGATSETATAGDSATVAATYNVTLAEAGAATDSAATAATLAGARAETATAADSLASAATFAASVTETGTAGDNNTGGNALAGTRAESATAADTAASAQTMGAGLSEAGTATDSVGSAATWPNARSESAAASDNTAGATTLAGTVTETATATDDAAGNVTTGAQTYNEALTETGTAADNLAGAITFATSAAEGVAAGEGATTAQAFVSALSEALAANDAATAGAILLAALAETGSATDTASGNVTAGAQTYNESLSEGATSNAGQVSVAQYAAIRAEAASAAESFAAGLLVGLALAEAASSASGESVGLTIARTVNETAAANDNGAAVAEWGPALTETGNVIDLFEASGGTPPRQDTAARPGRVAADRPAQTAGNRPAQTGGTRPATTNTARPAAVSRGRR